MIPTRDGVAAQPVLLHESHIFGLTTTGMLEMARDYVLLGRVHRCRRRGPRIAADVDGTDATYTCAAEVLPGADGGVHIDPVCDCPSRRPYCKHVLALLFLWADDPSAFAPVDAWEARLRNHPPAALADLLATLAMGADPLEVVRAAAATPDWNAEPPGRCLQEWRRFRAWAQECDRWPGAALDLGARIAGPPGSPATSVSASGAHPALAARQLAWWLTRMIPILPEPALLPWLDHLLARLSAFEHDRLGVSPPPELGVWLARLSAALPASREPERGWLVRFAASFPTLAPVFEAELQHARWEAELTLRLAVAPARPVPAAAEDGSGYLAALAAFEAARAMP